MFEIVLTKFAVRIGVSQFFDQFCDQSFDRSFFGEIFIDFMFSKF